MGGMVEAIERGYPQREIAKSAYQFQQRVERNERIVVGVNAYASTDEGTIPTLYIDDTLTDRQAERLHDLRRQRDTDRAERALDALRAAAVGTANTMPVLIEAARAYATVGEMCDALRNVWGEYEEVPWL
jgi:methylmalonyl-CoA mutase N-terminal domain/subunit